jgi:hypothetical protein
MQAGGTMTSPGAPLTPTDLIAACSSVLEAGGYRSIRGAYPDWNTTSTRLFEDEYNVVGVGVFTTCAELLRSWADLQGSLVEVISRQIGQLENKAWDGYLVLLTTGIAPTEESDIEAIRCDTTRLRKLVATGQDLVSAGDVERLLRPLLPLPMESGSVNQGTALDRLPELLAEQGINSETTKLLVQSFVDQEPIMDALHRKRGDQ